MARTTATPPAPLFVRHPKRPEWGVGRVTSHMMGMVNVSFSDGGTRSFRGDVLERVDDPGLTALAPPAPVAATVAPVPASRRATKKAAPAARKPARQPARRPPRRAADGE